VKHYRPHILVVIGLATVLACGWHSTFRNALIDLRFAWQARQATGEVVVVAIDAPSIREIGVWPWPRSLHADLLRRLQNAGVRDIVFDVDFSAPSDPSSDEAFVEALKEANGSVVLPVFKQPDVGSDVHINRPLKQFRDEAWSAVVNVGVEPDGLVRSYPYGEKFGRDFVPSMGAILAGQYNKTDGSFLVDFGINPESVPVVSYVDVLRGDVATLAKLKDRKVIVGGTALELGDRFSIPNARVATGPILQALAAESMLQNRTLHWTSDVLTVIGLAIIMLAMVFSWRRRAAGTRVATLIAMAASAEAIAVLLQAKLPLVIDTSLFHTAIVAYMAAIALDEIDFRGLLGRIAESRFQRIAMSLGDGLICTDQDHLITVWNPGAAAIFGYDEAEMIGRPFDAVCANQRQGRRGFSIRDAAGPALQLPGGSVKEFDGRRKSGEVFPVEACFSGWQGTEGFQYGVVLRDISVRKREAERIKYLAEHDPLTGLANRNTLNAALANMVLAAEQADGKVALLVIGVDGFQHINDVFGHADGDLVLRAVSQRLLAETRGVGIVARLSGDEFAIAIAGTALKELVEQFAARVTAAFDKPLVTANRQHRVRVSVGVTVYPEGGRGAEELLSNGHLAFCRAKAVKRGSHVVFESTIRHELEQRLTLEAELALAIERGEFELFYQPQIHLVDGSLSGAEALIRWRHPVRGLVPPGEFMPVVNSSAISERIASWVMRTACAQARAWELEGRPVRVAINLSPSQLQSGDLAEAVAETLEATGLTPSLLELEVTEDIILQDEQRVVDTFLRIQKLGVRILFDDFGTGYASLTYLKKFPLDGLKIDRSFVFDLLNDSDDAAIVSSTIGLSRQLGLSVIAEGIESRAIADFLLSMGCEEGQGYVFSRPLQVADFEKAFVQPEVAAEPVAAA
jgi:diguanylate cyclase (GGDEF)-like protein/PAS domain S-box-containing protein